MKGTVKVDAGITAAWYAGWQVSRWKLQWFKTWMSITPSVKAYASVEATTSISKTWSATLFKWSTRFQFWVGTVLVWANLKLKVVGEIKASAEGTVACTFSATTSAWYKAGVYWTKDAGWQGIMENGSGASVSEPAISGYTGMTITPSATCRLDFLFYDVSGPFVEAKAYAPTNISFDGRTWNLAVKLKVTAGTTFSGWLKKLLGLKNYSRTLKDWTLTTRSGTW